MENKYHNEPYIVFLGTASISTILNGCAWIYLDIPGNNNVMCNTLNFDNSKGILLDCGDGTYGQMCDHFGNDIGIILRKLSMIYITHAHSDHCFGLMKILSERDIELHNSLKDH